MAKARRRLEDLYVIGREYTAEDGQGEPVTVWLQKMSPLDHEKAIRRAGAAKAKVLLARHDRTHEIWQESYADLTDIGGRDQLIEFIASEEISKLHESAERELEFSEEWTKDDYLEGLRDAWEVGEPPLREQYLKDSEDPEARRVFLELKRFADCVKSNVDPEIENLKRDYENASDEELRDKVVDKILDLKSGLAWLQEYRKCEVAYATRELGNHDVYYFQERQAVDRLAPQIFGALSTAYQEMVVEIPEGKESPNTPNSSPSSEPPNEEETSPVSGPQVVRL